MRSGIDLRSGIILKKHNIQIHHARELKMDEQRMQEYNNLIHQLLQCKSGEEGVAILQANTHLVDEGLLLTMQAFAAKLNEDGQENAAQWLLNLANELTSHIVTQQNNAPPEDYLSFIQALFQAQNEGNQQKTQILLRQNLNLLDLKFAEILEAVATNFIEEHPETKSGIIALVENICIKFCKFPLGNRSDNLEIAISGYQFVLHNGNSNSELWAQTQNNLANAYLDRIKGDKVENLEKAIAAYQLALNIRTLENFPLEHLKTEQNRGNLHFKEGNWKLAIQPYSNAIQAVEKSRLWASTDQRRKEIVKEAINIYKNLVQSYINIGEIAKAIETAERSRCQQLIDLIASKELYGDANISPEVQDYLQQYDRIELQIYTYHSALQSNSHKEPALTRQLRSETLQENAREIQQLQQEKQRLWEEIRRRDPIIAGQIQIDPLNFSQMQALIEDKTTAILIFYTTDTDTHIFILYPTGKPEHFTCEGQGLETFQNWLLQNWFIPYKTQFNQWKTNMGTVLSEISQRLQLNELIDQHLQGIEELIIIPHLALHQIPFAALEINPKSQITPPNLREESGKSPEIEGLRGQIPADRTRGIAELSTKPAPKPPQNIDYLSDRFRLRTVPSCQILNYCHQREQLSQTPHLGIVEDATENLPFTRYECDTLAQRYQVPETFRLRGKQATLDNYKTLLQQIHRLHTSHHAASNKLLT
jgi:tetratricopeptide (TPR) repeat protein